MVPAVKLHALHAGQAGRPLDSRMDTLQLESSEREPPPKALSPAQLPDGKVGPASKRVPSAIHRDCTPHDASLSLCGGSASTSSPDGGTSRRGEGVTLLLASAHWGSHRSCTDHDAASVYIQYSFRRNAFWLMIPAVLV